MKRSRFILFCVLGMLTLGFLTSCLRSPLYYVSSNGILTYNRQTGQLEILWDYTGGHDSVKVDTIKK